MVDEFEYDHDPWNFQRWEPVIKAHEYNIQYIMFRIFRVHFLSCYYYIRLWKILNDKIKTFTFKFLALR